MLGYTSISSSFQHSYRILIKGYGKGLKKGTAATRRRHLQLFIMWKITEQNSCPVPLITTHEAFAQPRSWVWSIPRLILHPTKSFSPNSPSTTVPTRPTSRSKSMGSCLRFIATFSRSPTAPSTFSATASYRITP